ncbi:hypothetical protein B0H11DRAFT_1919120 [Mycena galericulata]|nr:hypothetical protein B0H11DRAFT_1919120 [Mycena galericulata]
MSPPRDRLLLARREHTREQETAATDFSCYYSLFPRCGADLALDILEAKMTTENILQKFCVIQRLGRVKQCEQLRILLVLCLGILLVDLGHAKLWAFAHFSKTLKNYSKKASEDGHYARYIPPHQITDSEHCPRLLPSFVRRSVEPIQGVDDCSIHLKALCIAGLPQKSQPRVSQLVVPSPPDVGQIILVPGTLEKLVGNGTDAEDALHTYVQRDPYHIIRTEFYAPGQDQAPPHNDFAEGKEIRKSKGKGEAEIES